MTAANTISVAIPTFGRGNVLVDTIRYVLDQRAAGMEVLVMDQSLAHAPQVTQTLTDWDQDGSIRWVRLPVPSITGAMNEALKLASGGVVLFLDDDVVPSKCLITAHRSSYQTENIWAVVGQILQPGEEPAEVAIKSARTGLRQDLDFPFSATTPSNVANCMAGNLSVRRERALQVGGFDENFVRVAYRFETDFARRICAAAGGRILFQPQASLRHLRASSGGTRCDTSFLRSPLPDHSVGDYYFAWQNGRPLEATTYCVARFVGSVVTRYHVRHPWHIPTRLIGELRGFVWALRLARQGRRLLNLRCGEQVGECVD